MTRYDMLVRVLDGIRAEAVGTNIESLYACRSVVTEEIWQARARAYIHLYLKVMFGVSEFKDREAYVTDGGHDGGVDGYYIDSSARTVYLLQSKFRHSEDNFENKPITSDELLAMQINRILGGEELDNDGVKYNGKIAGLQRRISQVADIGRYSYKVVIIANVGKTVNYKFKAIYRQHRTANFQFRTVVQGTALPSKAKAYRPDRENLYSNK
jgi:hypothetical protein